MWMKKPTGRRAEDPPVWYCPGPALAGKTQVSKHVYEDSDEGRVKKEIARFINEILIPDVLYILGLGQRQNP